jgi:hypothetical protein
MYAHSEKFRANTKAEELTLLLVVVAILVMAYQLNKFPGKKVFFLTSTAALASQQDAVFAHEVGKYETGAIYGDRSESFKRNTCRDCPVRLCLCFVCRGVYMELT